MIPALLLAVLIGVTTAFRDNPTLQYYRELNCKPIIEPGEDEPSRYDCSHLEELKTDQCFHNGKYYPEKTEIPDDEVSPCVRHCHCRKNRFGKASFSCAHVECPDLFGVRPKEGCYFQYELGKCCYTKERCESDGDIVTCQWQDKTYKEGETFYPEDSCKKCVCSKQFNATINESVGVPSCKSLTCDLYVHYGDRLRDGCIPTYYKVDDCCPIPVFRCPSGKDQIEGEPVATAKTGDNQCVFGQLKVAKGQKLNIDPDNKCVRCSCEVPPHLTCTMDRECYENRK